ncbi:hypothetical protein MF271_00625 (plasmid) [Deinococcus sp. KNUC1210]|uniref:hypothetical protein n=1 Tax=Deinococcus sp. KNUC1210 TaxID=2917691 RepID=UPI001EEFEE8F|nr:hypothetical protein [Deinococcus sp. KNUC1210]ULH14017.1 hypothetical protein MF271_00625 [Deinococcus sp. KNUC1210]
MLNAYEVVNAQAFQWEVVRYHVEPINGTLSEEERGVVKDLIWALKKAHRSSAPEAGFVLSESPSTVLVPRSWHLPDQDQQDGFSIRRGADLILSGQDPRQRRLVSELLGTALGRHLQTASAHIGQLWRHGRGHCELPRPHPDDPNVLFARRFEVQPITVRDHRWVLQIHISTVSVDGATIAEYGQRGELAELAERVALKRVNRQTRSLEPVAVRALVQRGGKAPERMELLAPEQFADQAAQSLERQREWAARSLTCRTFKGEELSVEAAEIRLILDTQITQTMHRETILSVEERTRWIQAVRAAADGFDAFGVSIKLADQLYAVPPEQTRVFPLPPLYISEARHVLAGADGEEEIRDRARQRTRLLAEQGYLIKRPLIPALAVPQHYDRRRAGRLKTDLDQLAAELHLDFEFTLIRYRTVDELQQACAAEGCSAVLAVLPEGANTPQQDGDTHDLIKRTLTVPSQCIQHDNTLAMRFTAVPGSELPVHIHRRVQGRYRLLLEHLVVKGGWIPYTTASAAHFNVHIGIDVGGLRNNYAMACLGYGLSRPDEQPVFLPLTIEVNSPQVEPIPDGALCESLDAGLSRLADRLTSPDFERVLFIRDGDLNGQGPIWQEIDGLKALRARWSASGRISTNAHWVVVEVSKRAEHWRQFRQLSTDLHNPVVGTVTFPFDSPNQALISTTGAPYLQQGTADPLFITVTSLDREVDAWAVMQDLVWEADLSFSKTDLGTSLPWVLHVADRAALAVADGQRPQTGLLI